MYSTHNKNVALDLIQNWMLFCYRSLLQLTVEVATVRVVCKDGRVVQIDHEEQELKDLLRCQVTIIVGYVRLLHWSCALTLLYTGYEIL